MDYKLFVLISWWVFMGISQGLDVDEQGGGGGGNPPVSSMPCVQKLLPCQPYLVAPSSPPASCCVPLKEMLADDAKCLCAVFDNPVIMRSLNVTKEDALKLPKACGANADTDLCKTAASPPGSPTAPATSSNGSSRSNSTAGPTTKNAANGISYSAGPCIIALWLLLFNSVF